MANESVRDCKCCTTFASRRRRCEGSGRNRKTDRFADPESEASAPQGRHIAAFTGNTVIRSIESTKRLVDAVRRSGAITIEAWIRPDNLKQKGPARIVTLSKNSNERNATLGQEGDQIETRLRTTATSTNGIPAIRSESRSLSDRLTHVVYTRDRGGNARIYVNGRQRKQGKVSGTLGNWNDSFQLALANELSGDRPWLGELHLVAVYSRGLTAEEVALNFKAGVGDNDCNAFGESAGIAREFVRVANCADSFPTLSGVS